MWWRRLAEVQTEHQNGEERDLRDLNEEWLLVQTDWSEYFTNCWSTGIFNTTISRVYREWSEKEKISSERQLCGRKRLVDVRGQRWMVRLVRDDRKTTVTQKHSLQPRSAEYHLWTHNTSNPEADGLQQQKTTRVPLRSDKNSTRRIQTIPIEHRLNATVYLSIVADHVHPFMTTVYHLLMYFQQDNAPKLKSSQTGFLNMTMSSLYSNDLHSHQISIQ